MQQPLRILHCLRAPVGGLFRHVLDLAREQAQSGHEVGVIADATTGDRLTEERLEALRPALALGITRTVMARNPGPGDVQAVRFTTDLAERLDVNVLHGHGAKGGAYARLAGRTLKARGVPLGTFYTPHGGTLNYAPNSLEGRIFLGLERLLVRFTDGLIFESAYASRTFAERVAAFGERARIVPNGLQLADFETRVLSADATDFLFIGELRHLKGVDVLLEALASLNRSRPVTATIVGAGPDAAAFQALADQLGLTGRLRFPGALPARHAFTLGRTLVVPSRAESFPYIVLEAGAAGIPLLTTGVGGIPEMLNGTDMPMLPAGDAAALARHMAAALEQPTALDLQARRFRDIVTERYTVSGMTRAILDFYAARHPALQR